MAQLDHFATFDESLAMLQDIFARGDIRAYAGQGPYDQPSAAAFTALTDELKERIRRNPSLYLAGSFSPHSPLFTQQDQGPHAGKFFLFDSKGGPHLSLLLARDRLLDGRLTLLGGNLSSQSEYQLERGSYEKASPALKDAFSDISKRMKKHLTRYKSVWIGKEALDQVKHGRLFLPEWIDKPAATAGVLSG